MNWENDFVAQLILDGFKFFVARSVKKKKAKHVKS